MEEHRTAWLTAHRRAVDDSHAAFISLTNQRGDEGRQVDAGPLAGVPFAVKDNIDTKDLPTTGGTESLRNSMPLRDAPVVEALLDAGARLVGKTNLHELAFGITGDNGSFGAVLNPHDTECSAGGSSSGSAAAVALGIVPFALGTDTGGSVRIPAAHCGVVGMRPTTGRYPSSGVIRLSWTRDTVGVIAATVERVAEVDAILTGQTGYSEPDLSGLRLGWPTDGFIDDVDPEVLVSMAQVRSVLEAAGVTIFGVGTAQLQKIDAECGFPITLYESARELEAYLTGLAEPYRSLGLAGLAADSRSPDVKEILEGMTRHPVSEAVYAEALRRRSDLCTAYENIFAEHSIAALLYPTVALLPPRLGAGDTVVLNGRAVPVFETSIRNTGPGSVAGMPAISIPAGKSSTGLPIGLSLEGAAGTDRVLLGVAGAVARELSATGSNRTA